MWDEAEQVRVYRRDTLYREVWAEPVKIVAQRYGGSDVAIAKTCWRLQIPLAGRSYFAKLEAGSAPSRPPLPGLREQVGLVIVNAYLWGFFATMRRMGGRWRVVVSREVITISPWYGLAAVRTKPGRAA